MIALALHRLLPVAVGLGLLHVALYSFGRGIADGSVIPGLLGLAFVAIAGGILRIGLRGQA